MTTHTGFVDSVYINSKHETVIKFSDGLSFAKSFACADAAPWPHDRITAELNGNGKVIKIAKG